MSEFHKMVLTILKFFNKETKTENPSIQELKNFSNGLHEDELNDELLKSDINNNADPSEFTSIVISRSSHSHFIKRRLQQKCLPVNIAKFLRAHFL